MNSFYLKLRNLSMAIILTEFHPYKISFPFQFLIGSIYGAALVLNISYKKALLAKIVIFQHKPRLCQLVCVGWWGELLRFPRTCGRASSASLPGSRHARTSAGVYAVPPTIFKRFFVTELKGGKQSN